MGVISFTLIRGYLLESMGKLPDFDFTKLFHEVYFNKDDSMSAKTFSLIVLLTIKERF